jgi:hypothetical protein
MSDTPEALPSLDFSGFIISLGTSALINLGQMPDPDTQSMNIDVNAARQTIDILALLSEKTQGNLTEEEASLLQKLLLDLRLIYVNKTKEG